MKQEHIEVLSELSNRPYPLEIRLKAGELLSLVLSHHVGDQEVDRPSASVEFITPNLITGSLTLPA